MRDHCPESYHEEDAEWDEGMDGEWVELYLSGEDPVRAFRLDEDEAGPYGGYIYGIVWAKPVPAEEYQVLYKWLSPASSKPEHTEADIRIDNVPGLGTAIRRKVRAVIERPSYAKPRRPLPNAEDDTPELDPNIAS